MRRQPTRTSLLTALAVAASLLTPAALAASPEPPTFGTVEPFTTVPHPGHPEGIIVDGREVHVTTTTSAFGVVGGDGVPSRVFTFDRRDGRLLDEVVLHGEDTGTLHGAAGIVLDRQGRRYVALSPYPHPTTGGTGAAVVRIAADGTQELYALVPDLPPCAGPLTPPPCTPTIGDRAPLANDIIFDDAGNLYISDSFQATVWRVDPGGGTATPWLQDGALDGLLVGPNGMRVGPDGEALYLAVMDGHGVVGTVYTVPLVAEPDPAALVVFHRWAGESPDGLTFGMSGRLYVVLGEGVVAVLGPEGEEVARIESPLFHNPASPAFDDLGRSLLVTNHAFEDTDPDHQTVVRVHVDDTGAPLARPCITPSVAAPCQG